MGVPMIFESSGAHSQAAQQAALMIPSYGISVPGELPVGGDDLDPYVYVIERGCVATPGEQTGAVVRPLGARRRRAEQGARDHPSRPPR
jgi:hypothetical protein